MHVAIIIDKQNKLLYNQLNLFHTKKKKKKQCELKQPLALRHK